MSRKKNIKIGFHGFWKGFTLQTFVDRHPYLLAKYRFEESRMPDFRFISVFGQESEMSEILDKSCVSIFYTGENIEPDMSKYDYALSFSLNDSYNNYRLPCWVTRMYQNGMRPADLLVKSRPIVQKSDTPPEFCNFIYKSKKGFRESFFKLMNSYRFVTSPGISCNNSAQLGPTVADKIEYQRNFRFSIAIENECYRGYTTEKIVEAFYAHTVPIYLGDPDIGNDFNLNAFINIDNTDNYDDAIERVLRLEENRAGYVNVRNMPVYRDDLIPDYAIEENIMGFFERIFD